MEYLLKTKLGNGKSVICEGKAIKVHTAVFVKLLTDALRSSGTSSTSCPSLCQRIRTTDSNCHTVSQVEVSHFPFSAFSPLSCGSTSCHAHLPCNYRPSPPAHLFPHPHQPTTIYLSFELKLVFAPFSPIIIIL